MFRVAKKENTGISGDPQPQPTTPTLVLCRRPHPFCRVAMLQYGLWLSTQTESKHRGFESSLSPFKL